MRLAISASSGVIQVHEVIGNKQIKKWRRNEAVMIGDIDDTIQK